MLTYICVTLIEFEAHRDAFIQNKFTYCFSRYSKQVSFDGLDQYLNYELRSGGQVLAKDVYEVLTVLYTFLDIHLDKTQCMISPRNAAQYYEFH